MSERRLYTIVLLTVAVALLAMKGFPQGQSRDGQKSSNGTVTVFQKRLPVMDGKNLKLDVVEVDYAPGASTPPHEHSASVFAYVLEGAVVSQVDGQDARVYHQGEHFYEEPHQKHLISKNASNTAPAKLLAFHIVDNNLPITTMLHDGSH